MSATIRYLVENAVGYEIIYASQVQQDFWLLIKQLDGLEFIVKVSSISDGLADGKVDVTGMSYEMSGEVCLFKARLYDCDMVVRLLTPNDRSVGTAKLKLAPSSPATIKTPAKATDIKAGDLVEYVNGFGRYNSILVESVVDGTDKVPLAGPISIYGTSDGDKVTLALAADEPVKKIKELWHVGVESHGPIQPPSQGYFIPAQELKEGTVLLKTRDGERLVWLSHVESFGGLMFEVVIDGHNGKRNVGSIVRNYLRGELVNVERETEWPE